MKTNKLWAFFCIHAIICLLMTGCDKNDPALNGDLWLKMGDNTIVPTSGIDIYDMSTHMIYLKKKLPYLKKVDRGGTMSIYVDDVEIYKCSFHPLYLSSLPTGPYISSPIFYQEDMIRINFMQFLNADNEPTVTDPRSDKRIIAALKKNHQYHEGLHCEILSVDYSNGKLFLTIELSNPDTFDYYYLDPDKMGFGLFHYFTNGPTLWDYRYQIYTNQETATSPNPWNSWKKEWLSLIRSGQRKKISLTYKQFEKMPAGKYRMCFSFPGMSNQISQKELNHNGGRIWLGSLEIVKEVTIK